MKKYFDISAHLYFKEYKDENARNNKSIKDEDQIFSEKKIVESFEMLKELGINWFNTWIHSNIYTDFSGEKKIVESLERHLEKYSNIKLSSLHYNGSIFDLDNKINNKNIHQMKNYIELVKNLKPMSIVVHPGVFGEGGFAKNLPNYQKAVEILGSEKVKQKVAENIRYFGEFANAYDIKIAVENIFKGRVYSKINDLIDLVNTVNLDNVGFCLDVGHGNYDGINIPNTILLMKNKLFELHLSDNLGDRDAHLPIGFGNIDWVSVINTLREINYQGTATFEFFRWPIEDKKLGLKMSVDTWKTFEDIATNGYYTLDYL